MKAVNLVPAESRRAPGLNAGLSVSPSYALLAVLAAAVAFAALYVTTGNTISSRQAQLQSLQAQVATAQAQASAYARFAAFSQLAQQRVATVREIANTRFDWHAALTNLSRVVPADTSVASLSATVSPTTGVSGATSASGLRSYDPGPAFELTGCTKSQDEVAALMSRLRLIDGVTRVTLSDSQKSGASGAPTSPSAGGAGCGPNGPTFDLLVFFAPIPGALPSNTTPGAVTPGAATPGAPTTTTTTTTTSSAPPPTTSTTAQPVSSTTTTGSRP